MAVVKVPVALGGTGADNAADARANLGISSAGTYYLKLESPGYYTDGQYSLTASFTAADGLNGHNVSGASSSYSTYEGSTGHETLYSGSDGSEIS